MGDELRLTEDLHLDSLGRVQLAAALEERLGIAPESGLLEQARNAWGVARAGGWRARPEGQRRRIRASRPEPIQKKSCGKDRDAGSLGVRRASHCTGPWPAEWRNAGLEAESSDAAPGRCIYPRWPWLLPFQWLRAAFIEAVAQPLVWLLANPRVVAPEMPAAGEPLLIVANHVTAFDGPLVQYALPGRVRRRIAVAMAGDMLDDYRHFRNPERPAGQKGLLSARPADLSAADGVVQCLSSAPAAEFPAQFRACRRGHGPRIQRAGLSRGHALGRRDAGALPRRYRPAGQSNRERWCCRWRCAGWAS